MKRSARALLALLILQPNFGWSAERFIVIKPAMRAVRATFGAPLARVPGAIRFSRPAPFETPAILKGQKGLTASIDAVKARFNAPAVANLAGRGSVVEASGALGKAWDAAPRALAADAVGETPLELSPLTQDHRAFAGPAVAAQTAPLALAKAPRGAGKRAVFSGATIAGTLLPVAAFAANTVSVAGHGLSFGYAFAAGALSFAAPCVMSLMPAYISFISGISLDELRQGKNRTEALVKTLVGSLSFVAGLATIFTVLGASAWALGTALLTYQATVSKVLGGAIVLFGLHKMGWLKLPWIENQKTFNLDKIARGNAGAFFVGLAFGFGWTPCVGPALGSILALAATSATVYQGSALLLTYALGLGVPFILAGLFINRFLEFFRKYHNQLHRLEQVMGGAMVLLGLLLFFDSMNLLQTYLPDFSKLLPHFLRDL